MQDRLVNKSQYHVLCLLILSLLFFDCRLCKANVGADTLKNICAYLGGRSDKNFLGSGNVALVIEPQKARVLFVRQWKEKGLFDWAAGTVRSWSPDIIEMNEPVPPLGAEISFAAISRKLFITRDDVIGMELVWKNNTARELSIHASFKGELSGNTLKGKMTDAGFLYSKAVYSDKVAQDVYQALAASLKPSNIDLHDNNYTVHFKIALRPGEQKSLTLLLGTGTNLPQVNQAISRWKKMQQLPDAVRKDWNEWFNNEIPQFQCSDPYFLKLYYYRWWSLYTKMIFAKLGHFYYPAPREGTVYFDGIVSYSGSCVSIDELRWMRKPDWALSTTKEFFDSRNLNDGYLSNHIWEWGIDGDSSNMDGLGRSVPYQNYAVDAFRGTLLVHPEDGKNTLEKLWPQMRSNLRSYQLLFDIDKDGLYETYPWSNSAGQEWSARFFYFDPIPEIFRYERNRTYAPRLADSAEDMKLLNKIKQSVVTDPDIHWPQTGEELYRIYYGTADHRLATVDQTTYAYKNFCAAASLAKMLNDTASEKMFSALSKQTQQQIFSVMWNDHEHFFYDVKPIDHKQARVKSATGFYPFWAKIASKKYLPMFQHLFDTACFWTAYPLPSLPLDYEKYALLQKAAWNYWNYATWPRTTCHVVDGALWAAKSLDSSLDKKAVALFDRYTRMHFPNGDVQTPNIAERYDPQTGQPFGADLDYNHSTWIDILLQHVAGITPQESDELIIEPIDMGWDFFSFKNIRYHNHNIDIDFSRGKGLTIYVDGALKASESSLQKISITLR